MRAIASFAVVSLFALCAHAVPPQLSHQGRLLDASDQPLDGLLAVTFTLWDASTGTNALWAGTYDVAFDNGYYSVLLGDGGNLIDETVLDAPEMWMSLTIGAEELVPRQKVVSTPYAVMAGMAEDALTVGGLTPAEIETSTITSLGTTPVNLAAGSTVGGQALATGATLGGLTCSVDDVAVYTGSGWDCVAGSSFDTTLTEADVDAFVADNGYLDQSAADNFCDLTTDQTVGGTKTFPQGVIVSGATSSLLVSSTSATTFSNAPSFANAAGAPFSVTSATSVNNLNVDRAGLADHATEADALTGDYTGSTTSLGCSWNDTDIAPTCPNTTYLRFAPSAYTNKYMKLAQAVAIPSVATGVLEVSIGPSVVCQALAGPVTVHLRIKASQSSSSPDTTATNLKPLVEAYGDDGSIRGYGYLLTGNTAAWAAGPDFASVRNYYLWAKVESVEATQNDASKYCYLMSTDVVVKYTPGTASRTINP